MRALQVIEQAGPLDIVTFLVALTVVLLSISCVVLAFAVLKRRLIISTIAVLVFDVLIFNGVADDIGAHVTMTEPLSLVGRLFHRANHAAGIAVVLALLAMAFLRTINLGRITRRRITVFSVGEALDDIPMGVLFATKSGQVLQGNHMMEQLNLAFTQKSLLDGEEFWNTIKEGKLNEGYTRKAGDSPVVEMPDGTTWVFERSLLQSVLGDFYQVLAVNGTREQALSEEYRNDMQRMARMNRRLREYNHIVDETVRKEELLEAKKRVHDNMGTALLAAKAFILNDNSPVRGEELLRQWERDTLLLREEAEADEAVDPIQRYRDAAEYLGVELQFMGELPEDKGIQTLIGTGIQECLTNTVQHTDATQLYVTVVDDGEEYTVSYSNNGSFTPGEVIKEGGGLTLIRNSAEKFGAVMELETGQQYRLILHIPKEGGKL